MFFFRISFTVIIKGLYASVACDLHNNYLSIQGLLSLACLLLSLPRCQGVSLIGNGHVVFGAYFWNELDEKTLHSSFRSVFPEKLGKLDDIEVVMSVHSSLMASVLAPGQVFSGLVP